MKLLRLYGRVLGRLGPEGRLGLLLAVANVLLALASFAEPVLFGRIVDALYAAGTHLSLGSIAPMMTTWAAFGLFTIVAGVVVALHADRLAHRRKLAVLSSYFEHSLRLPLEFHASTHSGRVLKVMLEGSQSMFGLWLAFFRTHCAGFVTVFVLLPFTLFLNLRMGLLLVGLVTIFGVMTGYVVQKTDVLQGRVEKFSSELAERASDALGNLPVVQSFTRIESEVRGLQSTVRDLLEAQVPVLSWWAVVSVATRASSTLTVLSVFFVGAYMRVRGAISVGEIVTFTSFATLLIGRLEQVVNFSSFVFAQAPKLAEFFEVLDTLPSVRDLPGAPDVGRVTGAVVFEDVSFSYDGKRPAVEHLSFEIRPGETVALVGATGSGKSTTLSLLHRAFDPQSGRILVDGVDIRTVSVASLRRNIGVVFQEPMLFARTIRENLLVGDPEATEAEIVAAMARAQATEIMMRQPAGLDAVVGERGRSLSGGERQRLSIARALLKDPPILVLDEATSALDANTEARVKRALDEVMRDRTTFVIAHRLATVRNANRIFV
ncbi:MAG TPA: glucan ABC transporter ATP-binding protein/ permease, partial [Polyangiaceae bacterium]|nr:glucan ABC transporter ATP-binding protein/ permease [Polyangiaceae bacterium]